MQSGPFCEAPISIVGPNLRLGVIEYCLRSSSRVACLCMDFIDRSNTRTIGIIHQCFRGFLRRVSYSMPASDAVLAFDNEYDIFLGRSAYIWTGLREFCRLLSTHMRLIFMRSPGCRMDGCIHVRIWPITFMMIRSNLLISHHAHF
jgi:hypothetical protein